MKETVFIVTFGEMGQGVSIIGVWKTKKLAIHAAHDYMRDTWPGVKWERDEHHPVWYDRGDKVAILEKRLQG